jgi:hypothetical protein
MKIILLTLLFVLSLPLPLGAAVIGDTVRGVFSAVGSGALLDLNTTISDPGVEFELNDGGASFSVDIAETEITVLYDIDLFTSVGANTTWVVQGFDDIVTDFSLISGDAALIRDVAFLDDEVRFTVLNFGAPRQIESWNFALNTSEVTPVPVLAGIWTLLSGIVLLLTLKIRPKSWSA